MPKFYISEHVKKERSEKDAAAKVAHRDLCQAVGEAAALERQEQSKQREAEHRHNLEKRISEHTAEGKATIDEINMLKDEGYQHSLSLARQKMQNRIETLTMDRNHYVGEIRKSQDEELDSGFLEDELEKIEDDLNELNIDYELLQDKVSQNINHDVNLNHDINL